jgi:GntR family transcriptional regulator
VSGPETPLRDRTPLPLQLYERLRTQITGGEYQPGARLPGEVELAARFGVSRVTVREGLRMLQQDGLVAARHGRGHYVRDSAPILEPITELRSVTELLGSLGYEVETEVLDVRNVAAGEVAGSLRVAPDEMVTRLERLRRSDGEPLIYSVDIVPASLLEGGEADYSGSLVRSLEARGFRLAYSHARMTAAQLPALPRRRLGAAGRRPWLLLEQVNYGADDTPLIVSLDYHRGDRFEFSVVRRRIR